MTLARPAPAGGLTVYLQSTDPEATVPATVTVPAGSRIATFAVATVPVPRDWVVGIRAERAGLV
ncbi:MAG: hypothetical protein ACOVT5_13615, partial [Armatimonadaceae bacterium]